MRSKLKLTNRSWRLLILFSTLLVSIAIMIPTMTAFADDCLSDPLNAADCVRTPGARQVMTTVIGVAGTAGVVIQNVINGGKTETEEGEGEEEPEKEKEKEEDFPGEDPCKGTRESMNIARGNLRALFASRELIQNYLTMLDTQYENTRQSSFWNGAVNVAMLGGSVFGRAARGAIGWTVGRTLAQNVAVSMGTMLGSTVASQVLQSLSGAGINLEDLVKQPLTAAQNEIIKDVIQQAVVQQQMGILGRGLDPKGPVFQAIQRGVKTNWAAPLSDLFGDSMSVLSMGAGMIDGASKLEGLRGLMSKTRSHLSSIDFQIDDSRDAIEAAQHSLDLCMSSDAYTKYLRRLAFSRLPSQG